jgi:hypothetical protein
VSYFVYGGTQFETGLINLTRMNIRYIHSPRGLRVKRIETLYLTGEIMADGSSEVLEQIQEIIDAFSLDYRSARLYLDDGTITPHGLNNDDPGNMTGVRVIERSWPKGGPEELANMRTFHVTLQAEFADAESQLLEWNETVEYFGNAGPRWEAVDTYFGPYQNLQCLSTSQRIVQSGFALGFTGYVLPPGPLIPNIEHQDRRYVKLGSGKMQGQMAAYYPTWWTYYHTALAYTETFPTTR